MKVKWKKVILGNGSRGGDKNKKRREEGGGGERRDRTWRKVEKYSGEKGGNSDSVIAEGEKVEVNRRRKRRKR